MGNRQKLAIAFQSQKEELLCLSNEFQTLNAPEAIVTTEGGITTSIKDEQLDKPK